MLILYIKPGCPYSAKVREAAQDLGIELHEKNREEPGITEELIARGGKRQVPYLVDEENDVEMYESDDIVEYLHENFGKKA